MTLFYLLKNWHDLRLWNNHLLISNYILKHKQHLFWFPTLFLKVVGPIKDSISWFFIICTWWLFSLVGYKIIEYFFPFSTFIISGLIYLTPPTQPTIYWFKVNFFTLIIWIFFHCYERNFSDSHDIITLSKSLH